MVKAISRNAEKGFTLVEMLIVVAIMALIAGIATIGISSTLKRQRLDAAGFQLQSLIESASSYARGNSTAVFVWLAQRGAPGGGTGNWWYCYLIQDTNGNSVLNYTIVNANASPPGNGADTWIDTEKAGLEGNIYLPQDLVLAAQNGQPNQVPPSLPGQWPGPNNWPKNGNDYILMCDPRAYPYNSTLATATQITQPTAISITHQEMVSGALVPRYRYDITVSPLWHTRIDKVMF